MISTLETALALRDKGFAVHWLRPRSKAPVLDDWPRAPVMTREDLVASYRPGYNVGFRPGIHSIIGDRAVVVLDVDIRGGERYAHEAYAAAGTLVGETLYHVISGSGLGRHLYLLCPLDRVPDKAATVLRRSDVEIDGKPAWMIELLSTGKNVVLPPSVHPDTELTYAWSEGCNEDS